MRDPFADITHRLDRIEDKLDKALEARSAISWLRWAVAGAWAAIAGILFGGTNR